MEQNVQKMPARDRATLFMAKMAANSQAGRPPTLEVFDTKKSNFTKAATVAMVAILTVGAAAVATMPEYASAGQTVMAIASKVALFKPNPNWFLKKSDEARVEMQGVLPVDSENLSSSTPDSPDLSDAQKTYMTAFINARLLAGGASQADLDSDTGIMFKAVWSPAVMGGIAEWHKKTGGKLEDGVAAVCAWGRSWKEKCVEFREQVASYGSTVSATLIKSLSSTQMEDHAKQLVTVSSARAEGDKLVHNYIERGDTQVARDRTRAG